MSLWRAGHGVRSRVSAAPAVQDAVAGLLLCLVPSLIFVEAPYTTQLVTRIMILGLFAMSLQWLVGQLGLVSLGHAAFFGLGGYVLALLGPFAGEAVSKSFWLTLASSVGVAMVFAAVTGYLVLRTRDAYFLMATLAFGQLTYFVAHDTRLAGGSDGLFLVLRPELAGHSLGSAPVLLVVVWVCVLAAWFALRRLAGSHFGHALAGMRMNAQRMRSLGYDGLRLQLAGYVVAGGLAGLAGYLATVQYGFVNPESCSWQQSGAVLLMVILGGRRSPPGALLGAAAIVLVQEVFGNSALFGDWARHWPLLLGGSFLAVALWPGSGTVGSGLDRR